MYSYKGGLTVDIMIKPLLWECIKNRKFYLKLHLKKPTPKIYTRSWKSN